MPTVTKAASSHTTVTTGWTNPSNAFATTGDNVYATAAPGKNSTVNGDFFFPNFTSGDIPDNSVILSVTVTVEWGMTASVTGGTLGVQLRNNGTNLGTETTQTTITEVQATQQVLSGISLSDLRSASTLIAARVRCSKGNTTNAMTGNLDFVSLTVSYLPPEFPNIIKFVRRLNQYQRKSSIQLIGVTAIGEIQGQASINLPMLTWSMAGSTPAVFVPPAIKFVKRLTKTGVTGAIQSLGVSSIGELEGQQALTLPMLTWSAAGTTAVFLPPPNPIKQVRSRAKFNLGGITQLGLIIGQPENQGAINYSIPKLTWQSAGTVVGNDLSLTLPMLTWQSVGQVEEEGTQFWITVWQKQKNLRRGKVQLITAVQRGVDAGNIGALNVTLPMLTWQSQAPASAAGAILITLPMLSWSSQGSTTIDGQLTLTLPMLTWAMADALTTAGTMGLSLPMMTLKGLGFTTDLDGSIVGPGPAEGQLFPR